GAGVELESVEFESLERESLERESVELIAVASDVDREARPALAALLRQLVHQRDRAGIFVTGTHDDRAVFDHATHDFATEVGAHDRERPVGELADAPGGDVGVLGGEIGTRAAAFARPRVALLEIDLVVAAVLHPD